MKKAITILTLAICIMLTACGNKQAVQLDSLPDYAAPLQTALSALVSGNGDAYLSAFPPKMAEDYKIQDVYLYYYSLQDMSAWLNNSLRVYGEGYGKGLKIKGSISSSADITVAELGDANLDYHTYMRYVTEENTRSVKSAVFSYTIGGEDSSETKTAKLYFVNQNGTWYLHPCFAFYMF